MPDPNYTHLLVILDRSSSMHIVKRETIQGLNAFVAEQAAQPGRASISLVEFNQGYQRPVSFLPLMGFPVRDEGNYRPDGYTALWDAVGRGITEEGDLLSRMPESSRPGLVVVVVLTDGAENHSKSWTKAKVQELIDQQVTQYKWVVQFLGASLEVAAQGRDLGIASGHVGSYSTPDLALASVSSSVTRGRGMTQRGASADDVQSGMAYTSDERDLMQGGQDPGASRIVPPTPARDRS